MTARDLARTAKFAAICLAEVIGFTIIIAGIPLLALLWG